jgi:hypothetical protein
MQLRAYMFTAALLCPVVGAQVGASIAIGTRVDAP